ncbi:MAG: type II secretion system protein [Turicibacter sp.]|nr:type II secretion system protein [Turicibacter sp.]
MNIKKKRGITLIELIMTMAVLGIIMATVTVMFISNSNFLSNVDKKSELQMEGQIIQTQLNKVALESKGISAVEFIDNNGHIKSISIEDEEYIYHFSVDNHQVIYQKLSGDEVLQEKVLASYVSSIQVIPSIKDELLNSNYMEFNINLSMKRGAQIIDYRVDNYIVFRNFKK